MTTTSLTTSQIRTDFIEFFESKHGHTFAPSSPVVPLDDPTLLFTNAGMNQFKDVFLGQGNRGYTRAVNSQKCIRAGGKHNDLEDVGKDTYHHTFFEMLGNWSFGDYFKEEAIEWAWTLLTEVWGLDKDRLYVTVFEGDDADGTQPDLEAETIWKKYVPEDRISRWGKKDNFWEMGASGPCGPCSEIHYDNTPDGTGADLVNRDHPDVIEVWNLVFIEFNRDEDGALTPLPAKHVDTGMGLERIARVLQGKNSNYDIDVWEPIFAAITRETGVRAYAGGLEDPIDVAYRVIADHIRCLTVAITDGARPDNKGRGSVLRSIARRAVRVAYQTLDVREPLLHRLVPAVVESLGDAFPELKKGADHAATLIRDEEESFLRTLDRGLALFDDAAKDASDNSISGEDAFKLHDTFGFPIDLTRVMAEERGMSVDEDGYLRCMEEARDRSRAGSDDGAKEITLPPSALASLESMSVKQTADDDKYHGRPIGADLKAIWNGRDFDNRSGEMGEIALITDRTNFYGEAGGQIGDTGEIRFDSAASQGGSIAARSSNILSGFTGVEDAYQKEASRGGARFKVHDTKVVGGYVLHIGRIVEGVFEIGDAVSLKVNTDRRQPIMSNHTATHVLNFALREVLGDEVDQRGSLVAEDRLRFDFSHHQPMTDEEIAQTEKIVNKIISDAQDVHVRLVPLAKAQAVNGVRAVFGERYPDPVRVVSIGADIDEMLADPDNDRWAKHSVEFCGGTHQPNTAECRQFAMVSEVGLAAGVRRVTALTSVAAQAAFRAGTEMLERVDAADSLADDAFVDEIDDITRSAEALTMPHTIRVELRAKLEERRERVKKLQKAAQAGARDQVVELARGIASDASGPIIVETIHGGDKDTLLAAMDVIRAAHADAAIMLLSPDHDEGKVAIVASVAKDLIGKGLKAGDWVRCAAQACGGGGGGRPDMAQAGGKQPEKTEEAASAARTFATDTLGG